MFYPALIFSISRMWAVWELYLCWLFKTVGTVKLLTILDEKAKFNYFLNQIITLVATQAVLLLLSPHTPLHLITYFRFGSRYPRKLTKTSDFMAGKEILTAVLVRLQGWSQVGGRSTSSLVLYIPLDVLGESCLALLPMEMSSSPLATKTNSMRKTLIQPAPFITALDWGVGSVKQEILGDFQSFLECPWLPSFCVSII